MTLCCMLSIFIVMLPLSSTTGRAGVPSRKMLATWVESMVPEKRNCPCMTSQESTSLNAVSAKTFRYSFCPSRFDRLDVPSMLKEFAHDVMANTAATAYIILLISCSCFPLRGLYLSDNSFFVGIAKIISLCEAEIIFLRYLKIVPILLGFFWIVRCLYDGLYTPQAGPRQATALPTYCTLSLCNLLYCRTSA